MVALTSTDADAGDGVAYTIRTAAQDGTSADAALFEIDSGTLRFAAEAGANYESAADAGGNNEYVVVVRATDNGGNTRDQTVTITINDVNEFAPAFDAGNDQQAVNVDENSQAVGTYAASDSDGTATQTYSIVSTNDDANSVDAALFSINSGSGALTFTNAPNREAMTCGAQSNSHVCTVIIKVTDGNSDNDDTLTIAVTVQDVNEAAPAFSAGNDQQAVNVDENSQAVGTYAATDADATATQTYSIVSANDDANSVDAAIFSINQNTGALTFTNAPNREAMTCGAQSNSHVCTVIIKVTDGNSDNDDTLTIAVTVQDVNEAAPAFSAGNDQQAVNVDEDSQTVGTYAATDADATATQTYSIVSANDDANSVDAALFSINSGSGALTFTNAVDFEDTPCGAGADSNDCTVIIKVTDGNSDNDDTLTIVVSIQDVNDELPTFTSSATPAINENVRNVVALTSTDADAGDGVAYTIRTAAQDGTSADAALFEIDSGTLRFAAEAGANYESAADAGGNNEYVVVVRATDNGGNTRDQTVTITINDVNEFAPAFDAGNDQQAVNVDENSQAVGTYAASDSDGTATQTYSIVSTNDDANSVDAALFSINSGSGALTFTNAPNREAMTCGAQSNSHVCTVIIKVTDGNSDNDDTLTIAVTVQDVNEAAPAFSAGNDQQAVNVDENSQAVGTYAATDADATATQTYSIVSTNDDANSVDAAIFSINQNTGALTFTNAPNREAMTCGAQSNSHVCTVIIKVTDGNSDNDDTLTIAVTVQDVNEAAPAFSAGNDQQAVNVDEELPGGRHLRGDRRGRHGHPDLLDRLRERRRQQRRRR